MHYFLASCLIILQYFRLFPDFSQHCQFHDSALEADDLFNLHLIIERFKAILLYVFGLCELEYFLFEHGSMHLSLKEF